METTRSESISQALDYMRRDMLHSCTFLRFAVLPHLTTTEQAIVMGLWDRTSRFSHIDPVIMGYESLINGYAPTYCGNSLMPAPIVGRTQFYTAMKQLVRLGLIRKYGSNGVAITCYPYDYFHHGERLVRLLSAHKERGEKLLGAIEHASIHYAELHEQFLEKRKERGFLAEYRVKESG